MSGGNMALLVRADVRKLIARRGLMACCLVFTLGLVVAYFAVAAAQYGGGLGATAQDFANCLKVLALLGSVAATMVGCAAGAGDRSAGVFRDLVATGVPRTRLFAARVPAVLAVVLPFGVVAALLAALLAWGLSGAASGPSALLVLKGCAWTAVAFGFSGLFACGVASLLETQSTALGVLLAWQLVLMGLLVQVEALGVLRWWLPHAALDRLAPSQSPVFPDAPVAIAVTTLLLWALAWLGAGCWRTVRTDA